ncbi:Ketosteroid isomerase homolog [Streptomyces zhaozhouensis]|uniref:Ketosteroid isomerase homolog n=1 Tax=Streptomyces zhaozhouensis TaxID=1300267 RepID=A0A286DU08_9ACTN|nr:DUF4440 domain-containing protein [Streptomyces zhaozhouensis]SOD62054.1 Ketosteroid isomerase homolog [Streptomyces zhaozhouensis]
MSGHESENESERAKGQPHASEGTPPEARSAEELPAAFAARFNGPDRAAAVAGKYAEEAAFVTPEGRVARGADEIAEANAAFLALRRPIEVRPRSVTVVGDTALLIVDWELAGGDVGGTATDVARRGADGVWRYVIDNPMGGGGFRR